MRSSLVVVALALACGWNLPNDCRNQTTVDLDPDDGRLVTMSWHIHYISTNENATQRTAEFKAFYDGFLEEFGSNFKSDEILCPFGPNYGAWNSSIWANRLMCSLERALEFEVAAGVDLQGNPWGSLPQRAFFIPLELIDTAWTWSKANRGNLDIIKHPNSGCMHDDHGIREVWDGTNHTIYTLQFPCNYPATGCQDFDYRGPPSCGCADERNSDSPNDSCVNCVVMGNLPPETTVI